MNTTKKYCDECLIEKNECKRYCDIHTGKAVVEFLSKINTVETEIGDFGASRPGGPNDYIVSGHHMDRNGCPSRVMTPAKTTTMSVENKLKSLTSTNLVDIITAYCNAVGIDMTECQKIINKLISINKNRLLIMPIKPGTNCVVDGVNNGSRQSLSVECVSWGVDKEDNKLKCSVFIQGKPNKYKFSITEYLKKFRISLLDIQAVIKKSDCDIIKMTEYGIIKPIVFDSEGVQLAIDGLYVYYIHNGITEIAGIWENNELTMFEEKPLNVFKKLNEKLKLIQTHIRYIAPYNTMEPNIIKI